MNPNRLLTFALSIQLGLAFFCPPVPFGERLIFGADVWLFAWVLILGPWVLAQAPMTVRRSFIIRFGLLALLFGVVFLHGATRPSLAPEFNRYIEAPKDDLFSFGREAVVAARFFAWILAAGIVSIARPDSRPVFRVLAACSIIAAASIFAGASFPAARSGLGEIYLYNPDALPWPERVYGVFRSPIEACVTLSLSFLILLVAERPDSWKRRTGFAFLIGGIILTKTVTALVAAFAALVIVGIATLPPKRARAVFLGISAAGALILIALWKNPFFESKRNNLTFRLKPWSIYWDFAAARFDRFLLGLGFHPHFSDNFYVFLFSRGGVFSLILAVYFSFIGWIRHRNEWSPLQKAIPLFVGLSSLTVDTPILRPVASVMICAGMLALRPRPHQNREREPKKRPVS